MKVVISSTGKNVESNIDATFGRAPFFLIVDTKTKEEKFLVNTTRERSNGVGVTVGNIIAREEIDAAITTNIGPLAFETFEQCGIKMYQARGRIKDALKQFTEGRLLKITKPTVSKNEGLKKIKT